MFSIFKLFLSPWSAWSATSPGHPSQRIKHRAVADLWLQDMVRAGEQSAHKVLGAENPADSMTKFSRRRDLHARRARLGVQLEWQAPSEQDRRWPGDRGGVLRIIAVGHSPLPA